MTIKGLIAAVTEQENVNFLLTNRIPRAAVTRFMGWFSQIENPLVFYPKYFLDLVGKHVVIARIVWRMSAVRRALKRDPRAREYMDEALTPVTNAELDDLEMFNVTTSARAAADKAKRHLTAV